MVKKIDILIAGSGPSALSLAQNTAKEGLSTLVISPSMGGRWIPTYASWSSDIEDLGLSICVEESWASPIVHLDKETSMELPYRYSKLSTPQLQTLLEYRASREGVQFLCEKVKKVTHHPEHSLVSLSDGEDISARIFVDATGSPPSFLESENVRRVPKMGFQTAYGILLEVEQPLWERGEMSLMDYRIPSGLSDIQREKFQAIPTFLYALPLGKNLVFLEETCLVSHKPHDFHMLKERLHIRMSAMGIKPVRILDEEKCLIPMGGARPNPKQRTLGFGAAAGLVHPATGYQLTYTLSLAPSVAQALRVGLEEKFPEEAIRLAWQQIWPKEKRRCWDMYQFGMDVLCSLSASETQEFFRSFFSVPSEQWKGFLSAQVSPYGLSKTMAQVFVEASSPIRKNLVQRAMNRDGLDLLRSVLGLSY